MTNSRIERCHPALILSLASIVLTGCAPTGGGTGNCETLPITITTDQTLASGCYVVDQDMTLFANLTVSDDSEIIFAAGAGITVAAAGSLTAVADTAGAIEFKGKEDTPGYWDGILFTNSQQDSNQLVNVEFTNGGPATTTTGIPAAIGVNNSRVAITGCTIEGSAGYGFFFADSAEITAFDNNTVTGNAMGAGYVLPDRVADIDTTGTYTGNDVDAIVIQNGQLDESGTWADLGVPFRMAGDIDVRADLTIAAGVTATFENDAALTIQSGGTLNAVGTALDPIVLTGHNGTAGDWVGVVYFNSSNAANVMQFVTVEFAGAPPAAGQQPANVVVDNSTVNITDCTIRDSAGFGIWAPANATVNQDVETANTFMDNALGDVEQES